MRSGTSLTDYQYTGQRNEAEIGLYYYFARFYDPALGRFRDLCAPERSLREGISADTLVPEPGSSKAYDRFTYTNNNPINFSDPSGYKACNGWDEQGKCVNDEKISSMTYVKGKTKNQLEAVYQNQGNSNYCGDFSLAMIIQLITGKKITGNDVANFMVRNLKQIPTMGIPGIPLASGAQKLLPNNRVIYQKDGKISQVERNVDNGVFTIVGVSWQTNEEIVTQMKDNVKNKKPLLHQVLVGHWMVVAGYDEYTKKILLLDSGKVEGFFTEYSYGEFIQIWTKQANSFIGSGDMLSIE